MNPPPGVTASASSRTSRFLLLIAAIFGSGRKAQVMLIEGILGPRV